MAEAVSNEGVPSQLDATVTALATEFDIAGAMQGDIVKRIEALNSIRVRYEADKKAVADSAAGKDILAKIEALKVKLEALSVKPAAADKLFGMVYENSKAMAQWSGKPDDLKALENVEQIRKPGRPKKA